MGGMACLPSVVGRGAAESLSIELPRGRLAGGQSLRLPARCLPGEGADSTGRLLVAGGTRAREGDELLTNDAPLDRPPGGADFGREIEPARGRFVGKAGCVCRTGDAALTTEGGTAGGVLAPDMYGLIWRGGVSRASIGNGDGRLLVGGGTRAREGDELLTNDAALDRPPGGADFGREMDPALGRLLGEAPGVGAPSRLFGVTSDDPLERPPGGSDLGREMDPARGRFGVDPTGLGALDSVLRLGKVGELIPQQAGRYD